MKREAETTWAAERVENALLRERINDVAAEVARLTAALEGPGSPIECHARRRGAGLGRGGARRRRQRRAAKPAASVERRNEQRHARRPHPRVAVQRLARRRRIELTSLLAAPAGRLRLTPLPGRSLYRRRRSGTGA